MAGLLKWQLWPGSWYGVIIELLAQQLCPVGINLPLSNTNMATSLDLSSIGGRKHIRCRLPLKLTSESPGGLEETDGQTLLEVLLVTLGWDLPEKVPW